MALKRNPKSRSPRAAGHDRSSAYASGGASKAPIALAMAGGGPLGAIYEIGALNALADCLRGIDLNRLGIYVGVSAGGILGAGLANGITPREMVSMFIETGENGDGSVTDPLDPSSLMRPALSEYWLRVRSLPPLLGRIAWRYFASSRRTGRHGVLRALEQLAQAVPSGIFSNQPLQTFLQRLFGQPGRSDDFRQLPAKVFLVATDLDSGEAVEFGGPGHDEVAISRAATASSALPGLFPPVEIDGRHYVDGALKRTLHASVALREGAGLVICLNPLVPYDDRAVIESGGESRRLVDGGLPFVVLQTIRSVIHSRMEIGMRQYGDDYPDADVVLFEPNRADAEMFFTNMFSYSGRRRLCEHAYQKTREELWTRRHELQPLLARHGVTLDIESLRDPSLVLVAGAGMPRRDALISLEKITGRLGECLDDLERYIAQARRPLQDRSRV